MAGMIAFVALGLAAGVFSGLVGLGGGAIMVPALVLLFGMSQHQAQGTSLAVMIPPVGLLAAWAYYKAGFVDVKVAAWIVAGFVVGGFLGAKLAILIPTAIMKKIFAAALIVVGVRMFF